MKFRLTPLNIVCALGLSFLAFSFVEPNAPGQHLNMNTIYQLLLAALVVVSFITDLIFRFTLKELKRIWIVESIFVVFTVILILILQK